MPQQTARHVTRPAQLIREYLLVVASVVLATLCRYALNPFFGKRVAFITFFPALVFSAWVGGWGGGLVALALSTLAATYYFLSPTHVFIVSEGADKVSLVVFIIVGLSVSAISSSQRKASRQAEEAAEDARLSEAALRESEARKTAVLEAAMDCIISADAQGRIMEFNPAAEQTFGYTRTEVLGKMIGETIVPPSLREAHRRGLDHYLATGEGPILRRRIEVIGMRKGGEEFPVEIAIVPMGEDLGYTAYLRDITARRIAEALQRTFLRDVLASVTEGRLILCELHADLPAPLPSVGAPIPLSRESGLRDLRVRALDAADGMPDERRHDLVTAVSEAGMNAIVHGGGGVGYVGRGEDGTIQVRVEDQGAGIAVADLPRATLARGYSTKATLGHGFKMMQAVDRVYVLTGATGSTVVLEQGGPSALGWTFQ